MDRPAGVVLRRAILSPVRHRRRVVPLDQGACLGIPGITVYRAVHVGGDVAGRTVLVQGAGGAVGMYAVALARHAGARVIGTGRSSAKEPVFCSGPLSCS